MSLAHSDLTLSLTIACKVYPITTSICQPSLIHFDVKIIEIGALKAEFRFHVSLPRGNTRGISRIIGNVTHAPEDVTEQGLHQQTHVSGRLA